MKLSDYLAANGIGDADFADRIGVNRSTVSRLRRTNQKPTGETLEAIFRATDGAVSANDFWLEVA
jgi:transcriptional regulator with XRE-family HTH domain